MRRARGWHWRISPGSSRRTSDQRWRIAPDPQLGQDIHLDRAQASRGGRRHMAVTAVLADQAAGPPQAVHRVLRTAGRAQSAEQRTAHAVGRLRSIGEQAGHLARVLAGQDLTQAGDRRLIASPDQPIMRDRGPQRPQQPCDSYPDVHGLASTEALFIPVVMPRRGPATRSAGRGAAAWRTCRSHAMVMTTSPRARPCSTWRRPSAVSARG